MKFLYVSLSVCAAAILSGCTKADNPAEDPTHNTAMAKAPSGGTTTSVLQWTKCLGGTGNDETRSIKRSSQGGYIIAANTTSSNSGDVATTNNGGYDAWIIKTDEAGTVQWSRTFGSPGREWILNIIEVAGGYVFCGTTHTNSASLSDGDGWIVKVGYDGTEIWRRTFGTANTTESFYALVEEPLTGSLYVLGQVRPIPGQPLDDGLKGANDLHLIKLNSSGGEEWSRLLGGSLDDEAGAVIVHAGKYIVAASSASTDGDLAGLTNQGAKDAWVFEFDPADGAVLTGTARVFGGPADEEQVRILHNPAGGYVVSAVTLSNGGDITANKGNRDAWVAKLDGSLNLTTQRKTFGGSDHDFLRVYIAEQNQILLGGSSNSRNGDLASNKGGSDLWVLRLNQDLTILNSNAYGGRNAENSWGIVPGLNGDGYMVGGHTNSNNGDVTGNRGGSDVWLLKLKY